MIEIGANDNREGPAAWPACSLELEMDASNIFLRAEGASRDLTLGRN